MTTTLAPADITRALAGMTTDQLRDLLADLLRHKPRTPELRINIGHIDTELLKREMRAWLHAYQLTLAGMTVDELHEQEAKWEACRPSPCRADRLRLIDAELEARLAVAHAAETGGGA